MNETRGVVASAAHVGSRVLISAACVKLEEWVVPAWAEQVFLREVRRAQGTQETQPWHNVSVEDGVVRPGRRTSTDVPG